MPDSTLPHHRLPPTVTLRRRSTLGNVVVLLLFILLLPQTTAAAEFVDQDGTAIVFNRPFSRIISLYPAHTENLVELGATAQIIGVNRGDNPDAVHHKQTFSDSDSAEKFLAAQPDLVLVRPMISRAHPALLARLRASGITVVSLQPTEVEGMFAYWRTLGDLTGRAAAARSMQTRFLAGVAAIKRKIPIADHDRRPGVYVEAIHAKMKTFSPTSITVYAVETAGGRNIATDARPRNKSNIAEYGKEHIIARADEIDIFLSQTGRMNPIDIDTLKVEPGFELIKAFKDGRVYLIEETLVSRPTPRLLVGIERLHRLFYPQPQTTDNRQ
ncbi:ABC transporter substrate-binding protein [Desulfoprunum benzoelyticum]|uniref:Iron complex transport system substrate-binding protein n=1 Tax=Desulfoprunum benzoelyticum TaxID=1506996 RepID=A0A840UJ05_9BACT|nr:ABC transporter substrate-binding protein [Desulfoprunum benzoelyticum]MBB5346337.1 iron complex transport system substrate-binding protein [Desulfoprunum benzoelyticum]MBM9528664.1 ABC transporter substrate-binding protein [Desulfoprunum benzoelyticum]